MVFHLPTTPCAAAESVRKNREAKNNIDFITSPRLGQFNAFDKDNYIYYTFDDRWRINFSSKYSLLQLQLLGSHDLKAGVSSDILI